ncbi:MAG: SO2930 family diheme c-type cytochrome [Saprospiraceae bacterium]|nr:hypothetical protein [Saprospiraceae bacterium]MDW8230845.1 SO2930 family diheme c-type cytochrome [Saprospiraceae bacterium]
MTALYRFCPGPNRLCLAALASMAALMLLAAFSRPDAPPKPKQRLSEYGFFIGPLADLQPAEGVFAYTVNAALFSDYAEKARFIALPEGARMGFRPNGPFDFPVGSFIIKNFFYFNDGRKPELGRRIVETRLLMRETNGWKALTYVWNAEQTDALLEVAGAELPIAWTDASGKRRTLSYQAPNLNQCKGCHATDGHIVPIGVSAEQLHRNGTPDGSPLERWSAEGRLEGADANTLAAITPLADYENPNLPLDARARAYLHANCAHCHNPRGPASTSGLFLEATQTDPMRLGIGKPPVAAGRGSGNRKYSIAPGKPHESILLYRMEQDDPGIRMPELGRQLPHREGIELIRQWIRHMPM